MKSSSPLKFDLMSSVLDGEAGPEDRREYQERLDSDPEAQRLHDFHARFKQMVKDSGQVGQVSPEVRDRLTKALSQLAQAKPPAEPTPLKPVEHPRRRYWAAGAAPWLAAAASIGVIFGVSYVHNVSSPGSNALALALARDHSDYMGRQYGAQPPNQVNPTLVAMHEFGQAPEMAEFPGLQPYDAKVCNCSLQEGQGQPILHVVYRGQEGRIVSMYGVPEERAMGLPLNETIDRIQPTMEEAEREALATWKRRGWVFSLVSNMPPDQLQDLAQHGFYGSYSNGNNMRAPASYGPGNFNQMTPFRQMDSVGTAPPRLEAAPAIYQGQGNQNLVTR